MLKYKYNERGRIVDGTWEGRCQEPDDDCPDGCRSHDDTSDTSDDGSDDSDAVQTCYICDVEATCQGQ